MSGFVLQTGPWRTVLGCLVALATSSGVIMAFTFGLFIEPLTTQFGWPRAVVSLGFSAAALSTALAAPLVGALCGRGRIRRTLLWAIAAYAACVGLLACVPPSAAAFVLMYALAGAVGAGHSPIPYLTVLSAWFDARRGLALGLAMSGIGVGAIAMPQIARQLIDRCGWRGAYMGLALVILVVGVSAVALLVHEPDAASAAGVRDAAIPGRAAARAPLPGLVRDHRFWRLAAFVALLTVAVNGTAVHAAPLLRLHGFPTAAVGRALALMGLASLLGRLLCGYALDRLFAPFVAAGVAGLGLLGMLLLWNGAPAALAGLVCIGFSLGAETDVMGYLLGRYFALQHYGRLLGLLYAVFAAAAAIGAPLMGLSYDLARSYRPALAGFGVALMLAGLLIVRLGPYAVPPGGRA